MSDRALLPLAGLAILPVATLVGLAVLPHVHPSDAVADATAAAWTSSAVLASLAVASRAPAPPRIRGGLGIVAAITLSVLAIRGGGALASVVVAGAALIALGHVVGDAIGRRIAHPGHLAPACAIAGGADLASVLSPEGPSNAIASSEAAVSVLVVAGPVPGHPGVVAPTIGLGDLVFVALLLGAAAAHGIRRARVVGAVALGIGASLALSAALRVPVPALPAIGVASVALVPAFRILRPRDRSAATVGIAVGVGIGFAAIARAVLAG